MGRPVDLHDHRVVPLAGLQCYLLLGLHLLCLHFLKLPGKHALCLEITMSAKTQSTMGTTMRYLKMLLIWEVWTMMVNLLGGVG